MIRLSAFADEISPDLGEQLDVLLAEGITHLDLRAVWNTNVLDLTDEQVTRIRTELTSRGVRVACIGSPVGKAPIGGSREEQARRLERALELAAAFETPFVRIFSFYPPAGGDPPEVWREEVLERLSDFTRRAGARGVVLLHENEKGIFGDTAERCADLLGSMDDPHFRAVFDPANFIQCGEVPYPDAYEAVGPWIRYVHVKDALRDGTVVPAGAGAACWPETLQRLRADGYDGIFSLEPHLASAGQFAGFSGPELFRRAVDAFRSLPSGW